MSADRMTTQKYIEAGVVDVSGISLRKNNLRGISDQDWERVFGPKKDENICPVCKQEYKYRFIRRADGTCEHD